MTHNVGCYSVTSITRQNRPVANLFGHVRSKVRFNAIVTRDQLPLNGQSRLEFMSLYSKPIAAGHGSGLPRHYGSLQRRCQEENERRGKNVK